MILDTNALSALADGAEALVAAATEADVLALPVVVLGEFEFGIATSRYRARYAAWLERLVAVSRVLSVDRATASEYARIRAALRAKGRPIPANDTWIAALALQHALPILGRNTHFDEVPGVRRVGW